MNQQAKKFIDKVIQKAIKERDIKGYRENLGYEKDSLIDEFLCKLELNFGEHTALMDYFYSECDKI